MKITLIILAALFFAACSSSPKLVNEYDKFKDQTFYEIKPSIIVTGVFSSAVVSLSAGYSCQGEAPCTPEKVAILARRTSNNTIWTKQQKLELVCDGERSSFDAGKYDVQVGQVTAEDIAFPLSPADYKMFANAASVSMRIGDIEIELDSEQRQPFRDLVKAWK